MHSNGVFVASVFYDYYLYVTSPSLSFFFFFFSSHFVMWDAFFVGTYLLIKTCQAIYPEAKKCVSKNFIKSWVAVFNKDTGFNLEKHLFFRTYVNGCFWCILTSRDNFPEFFAFTKKIINVKTSFHVQWQLGQTR